MSRAITLILILQYPFFASAAAQELPTPMQNAPCSWFFKKWESWGTDHVVKINAEQTIARFSFARGDLKLASGTDAYDYLETRCEPKRPFAK